MKTWIAFIAGGLFALALVVTCAGRNSGAGGSASAADSVAWEYAHLPGAGEAPSMPSGVSAPAGASSCTTSICALNAFGVDRWELIVYDPANSRIIFKRSK